MRSSFHKLTGSFLSLWIDLWKGISFAYSSWCVDSNLQRSCYHVTYHVCTCKFRTNFLVLSSCRITWPKFVIHRSKFLWVCHTWMQSVTLRCTRCIRSFMYRRLAGSCVAGTCTGDRWLLDALLWRVQAFWTHQTFWTYGLWFGCSVCFCLGKKFVECPKKPRLWRDPKELWPAHMWRPMVP